MSENMLEARLRARPAAQDSITWPELLAEVRTLEGVMESARDYLQRLDPHEIAALPPQCQPPARFEQPEEVALFAFALVQAHTGSSSDNETLTRMANFFSHATRRVAELMTLAHADDEATSRR